MRQRRILDHDNIDNGTYYHANLTPFFNVPISDISTSITFPGTRYLGGLRPAPTPPGVPVIITLPFCSVVPELKYEIKYGTPKSKSPTLSSCLTSPLIMVFRWSLAGSLIKSAFTKTGPSGANVSNPLLNPH